MCRYDVVLIAKSLVVPANSVPIFKGIRIYFKVEVRENESYIEISKVIIDGWCSVFSC